MDKLVLGEGGGGYSQVCHRGFEVTEIVLGGFNIYCLGEGHTLAMLVISKGQCW